MKAPKNIRQPSAINQTLEMLLNGAAMGREEAIRKKIFICFEWQLFNATVVGRNPNEEKSKQFSLRLCRTI